MGNAIWSMRFLSIMLSKRIRSMGIGNGELAWLFLRCRGTEQLFLRVDTENFRNFVFFACAACFALIIFVGTGVVLTCRHRNVLMGICFIFTA